MQSAVRVSSGDYVQTQNRPFQAWIVCFTAALYFFYEFMQVNLFNALDPALMQEFHVNAAQLGQLSANYFYGNVLTLFTAGIILDRVSTRRVIILGMTVSALSMFVFSMTPSIFLAEVCRFCTGIAGAFCFLSCIKLSSRWFPAQRLALVLGLIVTMAMLGATVAQTPMTLLTDHFGWRRALKIDATFGFLILFAIVLIVRDYPSGLNTYLHEQRQRLKTMGFWHTLRLAIINPQNWLAGLYTSLLNLPIMLLGAMWGSLYLVQAHGIDRTASSYVTSMIFIGTVIGSPVMGWISDRLARRKIPMIICAIFSLAVILVIMYSDTFSLATGMILFFLLGFFTSGQIISYPLITESNSRALTGTASGLASTLIMAGGMTQPLFGWLMDLRWDHKVINGVSIYSAANYRLAIMMIPVAFIIGLLAAFFVKETYCHPQD